MPTGSDYERDENWERREAVALLLGGICGHKTGTIMVKSGAIGVSTRYFDADTGEEITSAQYHFRCRKHATIPMEIE